jgi:ribosome-binding protein aMBF1 (putative translation factor)
MNAEQAKTREKRLGAAGWKSGDAADFLGMNEAERHELDVRVALIRAVRTRREKLGLSQKQLADRLKISKRTVERMEGGGGEITLEQILHAYSALGGRIVINEIAPHSNGAKTAKKMARATA